MVCRTSYISGTFIAIGLVYVGTLGCGPKSVERAESVGVSQAGKALEADFEQMVFAQGQLTPAAGVIPVVVAAGDRIESFAVAEGVQVEKGQTLGQLAGAALREIELQVAETELAEGESRQQAEVAAAMAELEVASVGVQTRELQLSEATVRRERAGAAGGELDLLKQKAELAESQLERVREAASADGPRPLVGETALRQQELATQAAMTEYLAAQREFDATLRAAELALEAAKREQRAAELKIEAAKQGAPLNSLKKKVELLRETIQTTSLVSPIAGTVLAIDMDAGQPTTGMPVMRIADLSTMECRAEVPVALLPRIKIGARATISGGGLGNQGLMGSVKSISRLAGAPRLPSPDPRQQVDYRSAIVVIEIDASDVDRAAELVNSQVDVAIRVQE